MLTRFAATGLTCGHCAQAVMDEVSALPGVDAVTVELVPNGVSTVVVTGPEPIADDAIAAALDEAGDYVLVRAD